MQQKGNITLGIIFAILCFMCATLSDICMKLLTEGYSPVQIIFFRCLVSLIFVSSILKIKNSFYEIKTYKPHQHFVRCIYLLLGMIVLIYALKGMPIADFTSIFYTSPFMVIFLAWAIIGEKASINLIVATIIGFSGILFIASPGSAALSFYGLLTLIATFFSSLLIVHTRIMSWTETPLGTTFWFAVFGISCTILFLPFYWKTPGLLDLGVFILTGVFNSMLHIFLVQALKYAPAAVVTPFDYSGFIWAVLFGYLIWGDIPTSMTLIGTSIIILTGLYIAYYERLQENPNKKISLRKLRKKKA